jgi:shikimate kinase
VIVLLNGPLGVGKSTLAEALTERIDRCVMLDGDHLVAANPESSDPIEHLHSTLALLVAHHRRFGYRHFVIDHLWESAAELTGLRRRLLEVDPEAEIRCFLLALPLEENLRRIRRRQAARAIDESELERRTVLEEREALYGDGNGDLGEPFDVSAPPEELAEALLSRLGPTIGPDRTRDDAP